MNRPWQLAPLVVSILALSGCNGKATVRIGAVLPLTGDAAVYGQAIRQGVELAFEEARAAVDAPHAVELIVLDSASSPEQAKQQLAKLYRDEGALAVIGGVTSAEALAMVPVADEVDRILLSPSASSPQLTGISKNFYRIFASDVLEGSKMGLFAFQTEQVKTVVILAEQGPYAGGIAQVFASEFARQGGEVLETLEFPQGTGDLSGFVERIMTLNPDAVYIAAFAPEIAKTIETLRGKSYGGKILTTSAYATADTIAKAGANANGVLFTQTVFEPATDAGVRGFANAYSARYQTQPDLYAAHGYDAGKVLLAALSAGGPTRDQLLKGMRGLREYPGVTGAFQFDEKGDVQKFPRVYAILDGEPQNYEARIEDQREEIKRKLEDLQRRREQLRNQAIAAGQ